MKEALEQQLDFIREVDKVKLITRQTPLANGSRKENDAEHSWHLALMAGLLEEHADALRQMPRVMKMVLAHDLVEIDAGDTYAYDTEEQKTQHQRELKAAERLLDYCQKIRGRTSCALG
ncbi:MAG: HD domain-containing protein [Coprococcus sp.]